MIFKRFDNPQKFVERVSPFLMANEAENNLMIGIANRLASPGSSDLFGDDRLRLLSCVLNDSYVVGAAVMTPPYNLILTRAPEPVIAFQAECIYRAGSNLPGLLAPKEPAELFAAQWQRLSGQRAELTKSMRAHRLEVVVPVVGVPGRSRRATADDVDTVLEWFAAFADQTHTIREPRERVLQHIEAGSLWLWTDPDPVAMALAGAITPNGRRIGGVYTPPDRRNHGYASAVVAELSQSILESGKRFSFLFTDLANPTANSIYAKIGYSPVSDYAEYEFIASGR